MKLALPSLASAIALGLAMPAHAANDQDFLSQAMEINLSEIAMGQLAQERGGSDVTRRYGGTLVIDHIANGGQVIALARSMGIEPPTMPPGGELAVHDQLMQLEGADFDQAFARRMIEGHREAIALFQDKAAEDGKIGDYAETTLPTLEGHLQLAEQILSGDDAGEAPDETAARQEVDRPVVAEENAPSPAGDMDVQAPTTMPAISADTLIGITVYSADNENIGEISDVVLSADGSEGGAIDAVIIDVGGFLGIGAKPVAVGFDSLDIRNDQDGRIYAYTGYRQSQLESAAAYDADSYRQSRDAMRLVPQE